MSLVETWNDVVSAVGQRLLTAESHQIYEFEAELRGLSNEDLQLRARDLLARQGARRAARLTWRHRLIDSALRKFSRKKIDPQIAEELAVGCEAFARAPADLPPGARLFPEQVQAAVALTQGAIVQMDTGEGKTYALLPSAFSLLCQFERVYIVCANPYLAFRDAHRTANFWAFLNIPVGLANDHHAPDEEWSASVVYTTLESIMFRVLHHDAAAHAPGAPILFEAAVLDEADAILLDQGAQPFRLVMNVDSNVFDWDLALELARQVSAANVIPDNKAMRCTLDPAGEQWLRERISPPSASGPADSGYFTLRQAVETSWVALNLVKPGVHYVIEEGAVLPFDPVSGKVAPSITFDWMHPLARLHGLEPRPRSIPVHELPVSHVLRRFLHLTGLSGTASIDSLEYLSDYLLPTYVIPPRQKRHQGLQNDYLHATTQGAIRALVREALQAQEQGRPVLIGTQYVGDAEAVHAALAEQLPADASLHLMSGRNDRQAADTFARAGEVGSIVVATQFAGRGVDIRLSEEAWANGGLCLLGLGRSREYRHDRQFLGRAGRQGAPFTARFYLAYDDPLLASLPNAHRVRSMMDSLGPDEHLDHPFFNRAIRSMQRNWRRHHYFRRRSSALAAATEEAMINTYRDWMQSLQEEGLPSNHCSEAFLSRVVNGFLDQTFGRANSPRSRSRARIRRDRSEGLFHLMASTLEHAQLPCAAPELENRTVAQARELLHSQFLQRCRSPDGRRGTRDIAHCVLETVRIHSLQLRDDIHFQVQCASRDFLEFARIYITRLSSEWKKVEPEIPALLLSSLLKAGDAAWQERLFVLRDHSRHLPEARPDLLQEEWTAHRRSSVLPLAGGQAHQRHAEDFIRRHKEQSRISPDEEEALRQLVEDFLAEHPVPKLRSSQNVLQALKEWRRLETNRGVSRARQKLHHEWIWALLRFLRQRHLTGPLPDLRTRTVSFLKGMRESLGNKPVLIPTGMAVSVLVLFPALTQLLSLGEPKSGGELFHLADWLVFGRLLSSGALTAGVFGLPILVGAIAYMLGQRGPVQAPVYDLLLKAAVVAFGAWMVPWDFSSPAAALLSAALFTLVFLITLPFQSLIHFLHEYAGLDLRWGWLSFTSLTFLIAQSSAAWNSSPENSLFLPGCGLCAALLLLDWRLNRTSIDREHFQFRGFHEARDAGMALSRHLICAAQGVAPHFFALALSWVAFGKALELSDLTSARWAAGAAYLGVMLLWTFVTVGRSLSFSLWNHQLNQSRARIRGLHSPEAVRRHLSKARFRLLGMETLVQAALVIIALKASAGISLDSRGYPLGLVILPLLVLGPAAAWTFAKQLWEIVAINASGGREALDFTHYREPEEDMTWQERVQRRLHSALMPFLAILAMMIQWLPDVFEFIQWLSHRLLSK